MFTDRQAFAGQHGFVNTRRAFDHHAINGQIFAGTHDKNIVNLQAVGWYFNNLAITFNPRSFRLQFDQRLNRFGSLALGARFHELAEQDQSDNRSTGFKIDMLVERKSRDNRTEEVSHAGAERHQNIHVGATAT